MPTNLLLIKENKEALELSKKLGFTKILFLEKVYSIKEKILFAFFPVSQKALKLAKERKIHIWNLNKINKERKKLKLSRIIV